MLTVDLKNIQSIGRAHYEFEEQGITQIVGENSNGKSIVVKAVSFVATCGLYNTVDRETLIRDGCESGTIALQRGDLILTTFIHKERQSSYMVLENKVTGNKIQRTPREGGLEQLVSAFGFITFDNQVCLQIFETFGIMPFVNCNPAMDYKILDYIISDEVADEFVNNFKEITYPAFKDIVTRLKLRKQSLENQLEGITYYDIDKYSEMSSKLKKYYNNISVLVHYTPTELFIPQQVQYADVPEYKPEQVIIPSIVNELELVDLSDVLRGYSRVLKGRCPTCNTLIRDMDEEAVYVI